MGFRCPEELAQKMDYQMAILGIPRYSDYIKICIEEKIARDNYSVSEDIEKYGRPTRFDTELKRAIISNKDIQNLINELIEEKLKEKGL